MGSSGGALRHETPGPKLWEDAEDHCRFFRDCEQSLLRADHSPPAKVVCLSLCHSGRSYSEWDSGLGAPFAFTYCFHGFLPVSFMYRSRAMLSRNGSAAVATSS